MHTAIHSILSTRTSRLYLALGMIVIFLLVPILAVSAQSEVAVNQVFETLIALPDDQLAQLVDLASGLNESEDLIGQFMEAPREFLLNEGIRLPADEFQIFGVNFFLPPAVEDEPWFGIAEPLEGLVFEPKGLGIFYSNVAIFIQEAFEPVDEAAAMGEINHQADMLQFIGDRFPGDTLDGIRDVMRALDAMDIEDPQRLEFLANPREYLIGQKWTLPAYSYRIIAIDMNRAGAAASVISDEIRPGLGTVKVGIGVFCDNVGIFLQRAI
ncbi:hypothetical protein KKG90_11380 [Candidatus Bipolaricaulota bacterium]|nr:hypothetical protein [Candidatus Bipolaricaulota bacterium]